MDEIDFITNQFNIPTSDDKVLLLDIDRYWFHIKDYVYEQSVLDELDFQMETFIEQRNEELSSLMGANSLNYKRGTPLQYYGCATEGWFQYEKDHETREQINYYRVPRCCHWIAPVMTELIRHAYPQYEWITIEHDDHSFTFGPEIHVIVDVLSRPYKLRDVSDYDRYFERN